MVELVPWYLHNPHSYFMKKHIFWKSQALLSFLGLLLVSTSVAAGTVVVMGNTAAGENQPGWLFNRDVTTSTPYTFNTAAASVGTGSLYVLPIGATPADKFVGENFINAPMADVNSIAYDFRIGSAGVDTQEEQFYMNVYANFGVSPDDKFYDCRYNVVPTVGSTAGFTTVTFDPTQAYPVTTRGGASASPFPCPSVPADMDLASAGSNIRMFALNVGDTSGSDTGLDGYLDNVVVNLDSNGTTVYDFEPDSDSDGVSDGADNCPLVANADQADADADGLGEVCDADDDNDTISDLVDNCPLAANVDQADFDADGVGDVCDSLTGPATSKDQCKNGGWKLFNAPSYKNQGICVSSVVNHSVQH